MRQLTFGIGNTGEAAGFLELHGAKLDVLALDGDAPGDELPPLLSLCPNITELHLCSIDIVSGVLACRRSLYTSETLGQPENVPFVADSAPHAALKRVVCPSFTIRYVESDSEC